MNALTEDVRTSEREVIEIVFPGSVDFVVLARFTAATMGARAGFTIDEIDDLRLAVDELSVSFGPLDGETTLRYEFQRSGSTLDVRCTREPAAGSGRTEASAQDVRNWQQARQLSVQLLDELVTVHGRHVANGRSVSWLTKRRGSGKG